MKLREIYFMKNKREKKQHDSEKVENKNIDSAR